MGKFSFFSLVIPLFGLLSYFNSLRLSSGHSGLVLTLSTDYAARASLSSPHWLVVVTSVWATSPLAVAVRLIFCGFFVFFFFLFLSLPIMLPSETPKLSKVLLVRGFPTVCKLLLQNSLLRKGLCP